jgi:transmembrane sensor
MNEQERHIDIQLLARFLAGETDTNEETAVKYWLDKSEMNRSEFKELEKVWNTLGKTKASQQIDIDKEWSYLQSRVNSSDARGKRFSLVPLLRIAALFVLVLGLAFLGVHYFSQKTVSTQLAETTKIVLPDGSKVTLNADSRLRYKKNFGKEYRTISLQGEAYFEVEKNPEKPFIIDLRNAEVKVLGTSFNVKAYKGMEKIEVTVAEGKVSVYEKKQPEKKVVAVAGEKAEYNKQQKVIKKTENLDKNYISWKTRSIIFENDSLQNIITTLSNVYHISIVLRNPELKDCTLTTSFDDEELETVFQVLESALDITIEEEEDTIYISGSGC